jgi:Protein of unknown function (DUF2442)
MHKIISVNVLDDYRVDLTFEDGTRGQADLHELVGSGVFSLWNDYAVFRDVKIGDSGELLWSETVDLCPDSLYMQVTGKSPSDVFPCLRREAMNA